MGKHPTTLLSHQRAAMQDYGKIDGRQKGGSATKT